MRGNVQCVLHSRAQFEAGVIDALKAAFRHRATTDSPIDKSSWHGGKEMRLQKEVERVNPRDVLEEAGLGQYRFR
jgi:hypothetical protein